MTLKNSRRLNNIRLVAKQYLVLDDNKCGFQI